MHLYLHIPFCKQKCSYCNFHFSTVLKHKTEMVAAICKELKLRKSEISAPLQTIYFGGGTPSILTPIELKQIFDQIDTLFKIAADAEITLEANPDDLNAAKLNEIQNSPINRLSIGVQSFFDEDLQLMRRAHNAQEADASIKRSQDMGLENITIDLIYGSPTTTDDMWKANLNKALALEVPHISSYALTLEPKTILQHQIEKGILPDIDESKQQRHFDILVNTLIFNGFDHYEISNFGKPGFHSRHNTAYWLGKPYTSVGPSAHGYNGEERYWNVANNTQYLKAIEENKLPQEVEKLSPKDIINELTMIGLRTSYGVDLENIQKHAPADLYDVWKKGSKKLIQENKLELRDNKLYLKDSYRFFADGIASDMFIV